MTSSCKESETNWSVEHVGQVVATGHGTDSYGEFTFVVYGVVLRREAEEVTLVYMRWPEAVPRLSPGDKVRIVTDVADVEKGQWGLELEKVRLVQVEAPANHAEF